MARLTIKVNGTNRDVESDDPDIPLLYVLRGDLGLTGTHFGCGLAQCGACTVLVDGRAVRSCIAPAQSVAGQDVVTIEGLGSPERPDPLQAAFIAEQDGPLLVSCARTTSLPASFSPEKVRRKGPVQGSGVQRRPQPPRLVSFDRNGWSACSEMGGQIQPKWVVSFERNDWSDSAEIRRQR
jgi:hypothetical protein